MGERCIWDGTSDLRYLPTRVWHYLLPKNCSHSTIEVAHISRRICDIWFACLPTSLGKTSTFLERQAQQLPTVHGENASSKVWHCKKRDLWGGRWNKVLPRCMGDALREMGNVKNRVYIQIQILFSRLPISYSLIAFLLRLIICIISRQFQGYIQYVSDIK